jgi:NTP pyrophosphatase (non-canonical NTP hydrolase)
MTRPRVSQKVIDAFAAIVDQQDEKGLRKYGVSIDEASDSEYDWNSMALEECADLFKYMVREIQRRNTNVGQITEFCTNAYQTATCKGWHDEPRETGTLLALVHSEVSEALEADRRGDEDLFSEELADVCIRIFDLCGSRNIDLEGAIIAKMEKNKSRPYKHGGKAY